MARKGGNPDLKGKGFDAHPENINRTGLNRKINLDELFLKHPEIDFDDVLAALFKKAKAGDVRAISELLDRYFGKSKQFVEHTGKDGEKLEFTIIVSDKNTESSIKKFRNNG